MTNVFMNFGQTDGFEVPGRENDRAGRFRELFVSNGNSIYLEAKDPYGFWYIRYKEGKNPPEFDQAFTSSANAETFVKQFLDRTKYDTKITPEKFEAPEFKTKKDKAV